MELQRYSRLIYDLHAGARDLPSAAFQDWAIARLRRDLPFASAWWGVATMDDAGDTVLHSAGYGTRHDFAREIHAIRDVDDVRERILKPPGITVLKAGHSADRVLRRFDARHDLHSILATAVPDSSGRLMQFISLYRPEGARPFTEAERAVKEALVPHLMRAWEANWDAAPASGSAPPAALLSVDGEVIAADAGFTALLRAAWPGWCGKRLVLRGDGFEGPRTATASVSITVAPGGAPGTRRVLLRPNRNGTLTAREHAVAGHYANGLSYKEIAKALGITPDTVRSYIKACYTKLEVRNKVQLQQALARTG
ncbi:helix-turn-helix transcriptional regulator [Massilia putida]|uniref:helix-turn-helix transcriptional regulator n=1 Tax=Massilia putida TaxID=1141883 RepID=UPI000951B19C|nr:helix-turn-helix transcriptional regulator [Massilia putida]